MKQLIRTVWGRVIGWMPDEGRSLLVPVGPLPAEWIQVNYWGARLGTLRTTAQPILWKWARLWPLYLLVLILAGLLNQLMAGLAMTAFFEPSYLLLWLIAVAFCTSCFVAGPILETCLFLAGVRSKWLTAVLFILGSIITIPCVVVITLYLALAWTLTHQ